MNALFNKVDYHVCQELGAIPEVASGSGRGKVVMLDE